MIPAAIARWLAACLIALICSAAPVLEADPEALQDVADDVAAVGQDMRYDAALTEMGVQRP